MPTPVVDLPGAGGDPSDLRTLFGAPSSPPPPPSSPPTLAGSPIVSSTPSPGQGVALDAAGRLPVSAAATGLRMLTADPISPRIGEFWYRSDTSQFSVQETGGVKRVTLT